MTELGLFSGLAEALVRLRALLEAVCCLERSTITLFDAIIAHLSKPVAPSNSLPASTVATHHATLLDFAAWKAHVNGAPIGAAQPGSGANAGAVAPTSGAGEGYLGFTARAGGGASVEFQALTSAEGTKFATQQVSERMLEMAWLTASLPLSPRALAANMRRTARLDYCTFEWRPYTCGYECGASPFACCSVPS